ncbi:MAG TPA: archease [Candidatus Omnitrophota bacterium]|nr:archease [Candidatus Omnitrophota bacterium]HPS37263.1 archease [Candidatus Omnitrophota bacterium]
MPYETFEHTADVGLRVRAKDLNGLFRDAAEGFFSLVTDPDKVRKTAPKLPSGIEMNFQEENAAELFMHWLQELLFLFSTRRVVPVEYHFSTLTPLMLKFWAKAVRFDPSCHPSRHEVKAVTHCGFRVVQTKRGWEAEIVFDI